MQLYLDCDGVLADFDTRAAEVLGMPSRAFEDLHGSEKFWDLLKGHPEFYTDLPLLPDAMPLWDAVKHLDPIIITGCPQGGWAEEQKQLWARKHFGKRVNVITCRSRNKSLFCDPGDIIIDDWPQHRGAWLNKGGIWIDHFSAEDSILTLKQMGVL